MNSELGTTIPTPQNRADDPCFDRTGYPAEAPWRREKIKVSPHDGSLLRRPDFPVAVEATRANAELIAEYDFDLQGRSLAEIRRWTRQEILQRATQFTGMLIGEDLPLPESDRLVVDGHQPQLFHPGVWVKNFVISGLSDALDATPLHLIVDNDSFSRCAIDVPTGPKEHPSTISVPFDRGHPDRPWEGARVNDAALFRAFAGDVHSLLDQWNIEPLLGQIWPTAVSHAAAKHSLPVCLTAARHTIERRWGLQNLELPLSEVCTTEPFLWFATHLLANARCFREVYNRVLAEYRDINKIRSQTHPVPELRERDEWTETPFWIWREGEYQRSRLFVRLVGDRTELAAEDHPIALLDLSPEADADKAVEQLQELTRQGYHLRTRALTTTLFARLCLADLFVHGIGGAKYDEMTDRIITRFFGLKPPEFMTASATHHLPLATPYETTPQSLRDLQSTQRDLTYKPEQFLNEKKQAAVQELLDEKESLIAEQQEVDLGTKLGATRREHHRKGYMRFRRLKEINEQLQKHLVEDREQLNRKLEESRQKLAANQILQNREFSFCLFPEEELRESMLAVKHSAMQID